MVIRLVCLVASLIPISPLLASTAAASAIDEVDLPHAIVAGNDSLIQARIDQKAGLEATLPDYYEATPLMLAAERDDADLTRRLLEAGADPDTRDKNGDTAMNWVAYYGYLDLAKLLMAAGADPQLKGHGNALDIAIRRGFEDFAQWLGPQMSRPERGEAVDEAVLQAIEADEPGRLELGGSGASLTEAQDNLGRPLLHDAARLGSAGVAEALLAAGSDVDARDGLGMTALMVAARDDHPEIVRLLLRHGADVSAMAQPHANRLTPLHFAAIGGDLDIIDVLVHQGAELDLRDADGMVPMFWALAEQHPDAVVHFIDLGADPSVPNNDGDSVASIAERYDMKPILRALKSGD